MNTRRYVDSQFDLFILSVTDFPLRDQRETMERPFFSLAKRKRIKPIEYENDGVWVKVEPHQNYGMATIWDADVLIWATSAIVGMRVGDRRRRPRAGARPPRRRGSRAGGGRRCGASAGILSR